MDYKDFIALVTEHSDLSTEEAERAVPATLQTLGERLPAEVAQRLAGEVPDELQTALDPDSPVEAFDADEFVQRVGVRESGPTNQAISAETAEAHVRAVLTTLGRSVGNADDVFSLLPDDYAPILTPQSE